jgi:hypothetical protein
VVENVKREPEMLVADALGLGILVACAVGAVVLGTWPPAAVAALAVLLLLGLRYFQHRDAAAALSEATRALEAQETRLTEVEKRLKTQGDVLASMANAQRKGPGY